MRSTAKLLLHVDINQTIMLADPAAGVGMKEGINIAIAKAAFGMLPNAYPGTQVKYRSHSHELHEIQRESCIDAWCMCCRKLMKHTPKRRTSEFP
jgi:hypothetical protein